MKLGLQISSFTWPGGTQDIAATVYAKLGIPLDLITTTPDGRPVKLNEGGRVIREWM